ncbi:MAG: hypothetical protein O4861_21930 [Trichodesmium sp. St16_bin4-tuft]|nr:hypothetical protein [Trichodesmium sp. St5_bin8]MDE5100846.1 hypothetical protein [Trichodesmium sp. St16_bin4-tuft]
MIYWAINDDFIRELVEILITLNPHKLLYYQKRLKAMNTVVN